MGFGVFFFNVLNVFPSSSQKGSPKTFPIAPQFYPILFRHNSAFMYIKCSAKYTRNFLHVYYNSKHAFKLTSQKGNSCKRVGLYNNNVNPQSSRNLFDITKALLNNYHKWVHWA